MGMKYPQIARIAQKICEICQICGMLCLHRREA
jgi:hypothetical protein